MDAMRDLSDGTTVAPVLAGTEEDKESDNRGDEDHYSDRSAGIRKPVRMLDKEFCPHRTRNIFLVS